MATSINSSNNSGRTVNRFVEPSDLHAKYPTLAGAIAAMLSIFFEALDSNDPAWKQDKAVKESYQRMYRWVEDFDKHIAGIASTALYSEVVAFGLVSDASAEAEPEKEFGGLFFDSPQEMAAAKRLCWAAFNDMRGTAQAAIEVKREVEKTSRDAEIAKRKNELEMQRQRRAYLRKLRNENKLDEEQALELTAMEEELQSRQAKVATSLGDSVALKAIREQLAKAVPVVATPVPTETSVEKKSLKGQRAKKSEEVPVEAKAEDKSAE